MNRKLISLLALMFSLIFLFQTPVFSASRAPVRGKDVMVVCTSPVATDVGVEILRMGGNAVDSAIALGFALAVTHPAAGNIGGGGFMVLHLAEKNEEYTLDYREKAPAAASRDMYLDESGKIIENLSINGYLAGGVPGTVGGLYQAWKRFGSLPWADLVEPAVELAEEGFEVSYSLSESLKRGGKRMEAYPESNRIFLRNGNYYQEGELLRQPELARTLSLIRDEGPDGFYKGRTARLIAEDMEKNGGLITLEDLASYEARFREPVRGSFRGLEVISMGPPSSGGTVLVEMLNIMERVSFSGPGYNSSELIHLKAEIMRLAFADRAEYLGDSDFGYIPVKGLTSKEYAADLFSGIRKDWAAPSKTVFAGKPLGYESEETTHYSIVDKDGNGVAVTTTINWGYGSGVTIRGAGFLLNNEMDDFSSGRGLPNAFGLIQGEANEIAGSKRPLSAMTPTLVKKDNKLYLVLGSPGGPTIINTVFQVLLNVVDFGMDIQEAVDAPRIHHQWMPDKLLAERDALSWDVQKALEGKGHFIELRGGIGDAHCIMIDSEGIRLGAPDSRTDSKAAGY
jgi:gamma-glutamyltranspeptidase / glutathione hydrolase